MRRTGYTKKFPSKGFQINEDRVRHSVVVGTEVSHDLYVRAVKNNRSISAEIVEMIMKELYER